MDEYYILKPAVDTEETGHVYPTVEAYENYNFKGENSMHKLNHREFPDFVPELRFKLAKEAKLCDVMSQASISASGLLVSERFKNIIEKSNLVPHKFYSATIESNDNFHQYFWMHLIWNEGVEHLNFLESKFKIKKVSQDLGEIDVLSYQDLLVKQGELGFIKMIHNYYTVFDNVDYDIFYHPLNMSIIVSEKCLQKFLELSITGILAINADNLLVR